MFTKTNLIKYTLVFFYFININCFSQDYNVQFNHISVKDGLSQSTVYSIFQDTKGFMWFGTQNSGLNRFDGYNFKIYRHNTTDSTSISCDDISDIHELSNGKLIIGTWGGGVNIFDLETETFEHFTHDPDNKNSIAHNRAQVVFIDKTDRIWIGTAGGGLSEFNYSEKKFINYSSLAEDSLTISNNRIWAIDEDIDGNLWIGTDYGLNKFNSKTHKFKRYIHNNLKQNSLSNNEVRNVFVDHQGVIWAGTGKSLDKYIPETDGFVHYFLYKGKESGLYTKEVNKIFEDYNHVLWVGTQMMGLAIFNRVNNTFKFYKNDSKNAKSLTYNDVRDIYEDNSHNLWVSTRGGGLNVMDLKPQKFMLFKNNPYDINSLSGSRVRSMSEDKYGNIWIGTDGGGLNKFNLKNNSFIVFKNYSQESNSISAGSILSVYEDYKGNIWIGYDISGVDILNPQTKSVKHFKPAFSKEGLSHKRVNSITGDKYGNIWIGTKRGLNKYNYELNSFQQFYHFDTDSNSIINNNILVLFYDSYDLLWIGTKEGLTLFNPFTEKVIRNFVNDPTDSLSLSSNNIITLNESKNGNILIGTTKGLNILNRKTGKFRVFTIKNGLPTDEIYGLIEDSTGNIWFSSYMGITELNPQTGTIRNFDIFDGLQNNMFSKNSFLKSRDGAFYFGGINGFNIFYPDKVFQNPNPPKIVFTDFQIFNKSVIPGKNSPLKKSIIYTKEIKLNYKQSVFSIWFSALDYTNPAKNRYSYKLEGFDKDWNFVKNRRFADYTNLDAGQYIFRVKASNNDNVWNENGISLKIIITPPFWKTTWFIALSIIVIILGIIIFIVLREKNLRRYNKILAERVKLRTKEIEQQKEEIQAQADELKKLSIVASETDNAVIIADKNGNIEWVNEGFVRLMEYDYTEFVTTKGNNLFNTSTNPEIMKVLEKCKKHKVSVSYTSHNFSRSGRELWFQTTLTPITDENDEIIKYIAIDSDITKIKLAEEEIISRNEQIAEQRDKILKQNNEIVSSILYASKIQNASFPPIELLDFILEDFFIFNKPRDIVSGDFYWASEINNDIIFTVADCTGHGVPGALMSMLAISFLNKIVNEKRIVQPNLILDRLKQNTISALHQKGNEYESNDGMDIALIKYNTKTLKLEFSGAMNSLIYFRNGELHEVKGDRMSVGYHEDIERKFTNHELKMQKNDILYLFTDGFSDQFGGKDEMRFLKKNFKNMLQKIHFLPMEKQKNKLEKILKEWRGEIKQIDDILVVGIKI